MYFYRDLTEEQAAARVLPEVREALAKAIPMIQSDLGLESIEIHWMLEVKAGEEFTRQDKSQMSGYVLLKSSPQPIRMLVTDSVDDAIAVLAHESMHLHQLARDGVYDSARGEFDAGRYELEFYERFFQRRLVTDSPRVVAVREFDSLKQDLAEIRKRFAF